MCHQPKSKLSYRWYWVSSRGTLSRTNYGQIRSHFLDTCSKVKERSRKNIANWVIWWFVFAQFKFRFISKPAFITQLSLAVDINLSNGLHSCTVMRRSEKSSMTCLLFWIVYENFFSCRSHIAARERIVKKTVTSETTDKDYDSASFISHTQNARARLQLMDCWIIFFFVEV